VRRIQELKGRGTVVTGASRGIGRTTAETLAAEGHSVERAARSGPDPGTAAEKELPVRPDVFLLARPLPRVSGPSMVHT